MGLREENVVVILVSRDVWSKPEIRHVTSYVLRLFRLEFNAF